MRNAWLLGWVAVLVATPTVTQQLVGPGAGGPLGMLRGHQAGRYRRGPVVREHPDGFFVSGSTIHTLNGLYRKSPVDPMLNHFQHHRYTQARGWELIYVDCTMVPYTPVGDLQTEWILIDPDGKDRFGHAGDCLIPRAGLSWQRVQRPAFGRLQIGGSAATFQDADWDASVWVAGDAVTIDELAEGGRVKVTVERTGQTLNTDAWRLQMLLPSEPEHAEGSSSNGTDAPLAASALSDSHTTRDDKGELPWQFLALLDPRTVEECAQKERDFEDRLRNEAARLVHTLPDAGGSPASDLPSAAEVETTCLEDQFELAVRGLTDLIESRPAPSVRAAIVLHTKRAICHRRSGAPQDAVWDANAALELAPSFGPALRQRALATLDGGNATAAVTELERLLRVEPTTLNLDVWLVQAHARARRTGSAPVAGEFLVGDRAVTRDAVPGFWEAGTAVDVIGLGPPSAPVAIRLPAGRVIAVHPTDIERLGPADSSLFLNGGAAVLEQDHYVTLGLPIDFTPSQLKDAYKRLSRQHHPDRAGGSTSRFQAVAEAAAILSDPARRLEYDLGVDLPASGRDDAPTLRDEITMRYYPSLAMHSPYGDPLQIKKDELARDLATEEQQRRLRVAAEQRQLEAEQSDGNPREEL